MGTDSQVQDMARENLMRDVESTITHLENGAGTVDTCPNHAWLAKGVVLCLRMLRTQIQSVQATSRQHLAVSGVATFVAVVLVTVIDKYIGK